MPLFDALLFDFDGVLANTEPLHFAAWRDTLAPVGITFTWEFYLANCVGVADDALFPKVFPMDDAEQWVAQKRKLYRAALEAQPPFLDRTVAVVQRLSKRYRLAVVSSSARVEVEPPLAAAGLSGCFRFLLTREDVVNIKPAPEPYLKAAARMGSSNPLVIEDSVSGIAAGKAAGFQVLEIQSPESLAHQVEALLGPPG